MSLTLAATWQFLWGRGYVLFQNWNWPIYAGSRWPFAPGVFNQYGWSVLGPDPEGLSRAATNSIPFLLAPLNNPEVLEKAYVVFAFAAEYALAAIAASLCARWLFGSSDSRAGLLSFEFSFTFLFLVNPAAIQWEAGLLVPFMWGAPLIAIAVASGGLSVLRADWRYALLSGTTLSIAATQDPRLFVWGWGCELVIFLWMLATRFDGRKLVRRVATIALSSIPGALLALYAYTWAGGPGGGQIRVGTFASIGVLSANSGPANSITLTGFYISGVTYSPPSILWVSTPIGQIATAGNPALYLLPAGFLTSVWLASLWVLPALAFSALLFRKYRQVTIPVSLIAVTSLVFASGTQGPFAAVVEAEAWLGTIGLGGLGSLAQTVFGVPSYVLVATEAAYVCLGALSLRCIYDALTSRIASPAPNRSLVPHRVQESYTRLSGRQRLLAGRCAVVVLLCVLAFGSWQAFSGSFYPAGLSPGTSESDIPSIGALTPTSPPQADVAIASYIDHNPLNGSVYWPGPESYSYPWNSKWSPPLSESSSETVATIPGISTVVSENLTGELTPLLAYFGVSYVVIDNQSAAGLEYEFGVPDVGQVVGVFLSSPQLDCLINDAPDAWLFQVNDSQGLAAPSEFVANPLGVPGANLPTAVSALSGVGLTPAFASKTAGTNAQVDIGGTFPSITNSTYSILTAANLSLEMPSNLVEAFPGGAVADASLSLNSTGETALPDPYHNWTVAIWSGLTPNVYANVSGGSALNLTVIGSPLTLSANYLSSLINGDTGGIGVNSSDLVTFNASVDLIGSGNVHGSAFINVVASTEEGQNIAQLSSVTETLEPDHELKLALQGQLPVGSAFFTIRIFGDFVGQLSLSHVRLTWSELSPSPQAATGYVLKGGNLTTTVPPVEASGESGANFTLALQIEGFGNLTICTPRCVFESVIGGSTLSWVTIPELAVASGTPQELNLNGDYSVSTVIEIPGTAKEALSTAKVGPMNAQYSISGSVDSSGGVLSLDLTYSPSWRCSYNGSESLGGMPSQFGLIYFSLAPGSYAFTVSLAGIAFQPYLVVGWSAATIGAASLFLFPRRFRKLRRLVETLSSGDLVRRTLGQKRNPTHGTTR